MGVCKMREQFNFNIPKQWVENAKKGLCPICGRTKFEFDKGMQVYCSKKCRDEYSSKIMTWNELKERVYNRDGHVCKKCKISFDRLQEIKKDRRKKWINENKDYIEKLRFKELKELGEKFEVSYQEMFDDEKFFNRYISYDITKEIEEGLPAFHEMCFEVDHITAICNNGDMWDENNLQILCGRCHKEKTRDDLKLMKGNVQIRKIVSE